MRARVIVTLKSGVLDPQGKAIEGALASLGISGIASVRQGKVFDVEIEGDDAEGALRLACERLLANTVVENYRIERGEGASPPVPVADPPAAQQHPAEPATDVTEIAARDADMPTEGHP